MTHQTAQEQLEAAEKAIGKAYRMFIYKPTPSRYETLTEAAKALLKAQAQVYQSYLQTETEVA